MTPFMLGESSTHLAGKAPPIYDLYATVNHYGAVYMGHYIAQVKPPCLQQRGEYNRSISGCVHRKFMVCTGHRLQC